MVGNKIEIIKYECKNYGCKKEILDIVVNIDNEKDEEIILATICTYITRQSKDSVLTLVDLHDIPLSDISIELLGKHYKATKSFIRKTAVVPNDTYMRTFVMEVNKALDKKFEIFKDKKEAIEWLVSKNPEEIDEFTTVI